MENQENKGKKRQKHPDRIVLDKESVEVVESISAQINKAFGGMVKLSNKELTNFLVQSRSEKLSSSELKEIKDKYFDDVRAAQWAVQRLKQAKSGGENLSLNEVLQMLHSPISKEKRPFNSESKRKKKTEGTGPHEDAIDLNVEETRT
jgi:hypothetical protein